MKVVLPRMFRISVIVLLAMICNFPTHAKAQGVQKPAKLYGKVALIMKNGDVKPVAKRDFCLTQIDLWGHNEQLYKEGIELYGPEPERPAIFKSTKEFDEYNRKDREYDQKSTEFWQKVNGFRLPRLREAFQKAINEGKCLTFKTEFDGSYSIDNIPPGEYRIVNYSEATSFYTLMGGSSIRWNLPITLKEGQAFKLDLSNENAAEISN